MYWERKEKDREKKSLKNIIELNEIEKRCNTLSL